VAATDQGASSAADETWRWRSHVFEARVKEATLRTWRLEFRPLDERRRGVGRAAIRPLGWTN
jgi:hypothetical protein